MSRMVPLPGHVPTQSSQAVLPTAPKPVAAKAPKSLRADFARELEQRLEGWLGAPGSDRRTALASSLKPYMRSGEVAATAGIDLGKLPEQARTDLVKLQGAAEGIEAIFVKKLLSQMRSVSFLDEKATPMADLAKDMMDQAIAEQTAKSGSTIGIARLVFLDTAQSLVRGAIASRPASGTDDKP